MTPNDKHDDKVAAPNFGAPNSEARGEFSVFIPQPERRAGPSARHILFAGVATACLLGVGLGLWARPAMSERQAAGDVKPAIAAPKAEPAAARKLQIVVDDRPAPLGAPIEVLPSVGGRRAPLVAPQAPAPTPAPVTLPGGLMRVRDVTPPEPAPKTAATPAPAPSAAPAVEHRLAFAPLVATAASAFEAARQAFAKVRVHDDNATEVARTDDPPAKPVRKAASGKPSAAKLAAAKAAAQAQADSKARAAAVVLAEARVRRDAQRAAHKAELAQAAAAKAAAQKLELAQAAKAAKAQKLQLAQAAKAAKAARAEKLQLAQAAQAAAKAQKLQLAQAASRAQKLQLAKAAQAKAQRLQLAQAAQAAKAERLEELRQSKAEARQHQLELAKAEAKGRAEALAEARADERKRERLVALAHAVQRLLPHQASLEVSKAESRHLRKSRREVRIEQASLKSRKASRFAEQPSRTRAAPLAPPPRASGLMQVSAPRCGNRDAGEAMVCADPSLGAADRQLARAYQTARAAGVPDAQLQRQQQRWLAARSAAAREAPWAVHDVYVARIAELNGQAREAHPDGY